MDELSLQQAVEYVAGFGQWWALPVLAASAVVEYVFPPFPGDTVTLAGAVLARVGDWSWSLVFSALTLGSLAGSALDYWIGRLWLKRRKGSSPGWGCVEGSGGAAAAPPAAPEEEQPPAGQQAQDSRLERVLAGYRRYGPAFLILNRFMPGIRAFFFVAAGMAGLKTWSVLFYATLSAAAWNALLLLAGYHVGDNLPRLEALFRTYFTAVWVVLSVLAVAGLTVWAVKAMRRRARGARV